jgi:flagella basal body P-ring formation protein FlgA
MGLYESRGFIMKENILGVLLIFASSYLYADSTQSLELLKNKIETYALNELSHYTEGKIQIITGRIDPRLNLKNCAEDKLEIFNPYQTPMLSTSTMAVKCQEENNHWTLYVPIKVTVLKTVLVTKRALIKGSVITNDDLYPAELDAQKLKQGYFTDAKELLGLICKQDIPADTTLNPHNIELAKLVHTGEQVTIRVTTKNLNISMDGVAMSEGVLGQSIKVKNLTSKRIIEAQVSGDKQVTIVL